MSLCHAVSSVSNPDSEDNSCLLWYIPSIIYIFYFILLFCSHFYHPFFGFPFSSSERKYFYPNFRRHSLHRTTNSPQDSKDACLSFHTNLALIGRGETFKDHGVMMLHCLHGCGLCLLCKGTNGGCFIVMENQSASWLCFSPCCWNQPSLRLEL